MIGNRNRGKLKHILALLLALAFAAGSAGAEGAWTPADIAAQDASYNLQQAEPQMTFRSGGEKVDSIEGADSLTLLFFGSAEHPLPQDTETVMYFELPRNVAAGELQDTEGDTVSTVYDAELNRLYFRWKSAGGGNAFSVTVPVKKREPFYTVNHILREGDGNEKLYRSETKPFTSGMLIREARIVASAEAVRFTILLPMRMVLSILP